MKPKYDLRKKTAQELLDTICLYKLEDSLDNVITMFEEYRPGGASYNSRFKRVFIELANEYGYTVLQVLGERDCTSEELEGLNKQNETDNKRQEEYDKREFERIKKTYGWK